MSATTAQQTCPGGLCLYDGTNFTGAQLNLAPSGTCVSLVAQGWGDRARSAINTNANSAVLFMNDGCVGGPFQIPGGTGNPDFGSFRPESVLVQ